MATPKLERTKNARRVQLRAGRRMKIGTGHAMKMQYYQPWKLESATLPALEARLNEISQQR